VPGVCTLDASPPILGNLLWCAKLVITKKAVQLSKGVWEGDTPFLLPQFPSGWT